MIQPRNVGLRNHKPQLLQFKDQIHQLDAAGDYKLFTFQTEENNKKTFCVSGDVLTYM